MTIALDRPLSAAAGAADVRRAAPFSAPGPRPAADRPRRAAGSDAAPGAAVEVTLTVCLPPGTADVEAARLADALRAQACTLTAGVPGRTRVDIQSPRPFTATLGSATRSTLPPTRAHGAAPAARTVRERRPGIVSPNSPARRDVEAARLRTLRATAVSPASPAAAPESSLVIDLYGRRARLDGEDLDLTYKEFELLAHLARRAREIVSRQELMSSVWAGAEADTGERTVDVHVRRVRTKLGRYRRLISTVRGAGYRLDPGSDVAVLG